MGATITSGKAVAAIATPAGPCYVLYERVHEKRSYPHTPHWEVAAIGSRADVLSRIGQSTASTCGGMLQSTAGYIKPANYWRGWMRALAKPLHLPSGAAATLPVHRTKYEAIDADKMRAALVAAGLASVADEIDRLRQTPGAKDSFAVPLEQHGLAIAASLNAMSMAPWNVIDVHPALRNASAEPSPEWPRWSASPEPVVALSEGPVAVSTGYNAFARLGSLERGALCMGRWPDGRWTMCDSDYVLLGRAITTASKLEIDHPGSVEATIARASSELATCQDAPGADEARIRVLPLPADRLWNEWSIESYAKAAGTVNADGTTTVRAIASLLWLDREIANCIELVDTNVLACSGESQQQESTELT